MVFVWNKWLWHPRALTFPFTGDKWRAPAASAPHPRPKWPVRQRADDFRSLVTHIFACTVQQGECIDSVLLALCRKPTREIS